MGIWANLVLLVESLGAIWGAKRALDGAKMLPEWPYGAFLGTAWALFGVFLVPSWGRLGPF